MLEIFKNKHKTCCSPAIFANYISKRKNTDYTTPHNPFCAARPSTVNCGANAKIYSNLPSFMRSTNREKQYLDTISQTAPKKLLQTNQNSYALAINKRINFLPQNCHFKTSESRRKMRQFVNI